jgi:micrococcal nuclease
MGRRTDPAFLPKALFSGLALACLWQTPEFNPSIRRMEREDAAIVARVYDGDTIEVRLGTGEERRVRLIGIDSPEMDDKREEVLFFAHMARRFAFYHLYQKSVRMTYDWERTDKYGRTLAYVVLDDGTLFNELIVKEGFAHAFTKYPYREDMKSRIREAEREARRLEKGLWRKDAWPAIRAAEARSRLGSIATVEFVCRDVAEQGRYLYLRTDDDFEVFVPAPPPIPDAELRSLVGRKVAVTGFIEEFKGRVQIVLSLRSQLGDGAEPSLVSSS